MSGEQKPRANPWTAEGLADQTRPDLETIRANASRLGVVELVAMCDAELAKRGPIKARSTAHARTKNADTDVVVEYHFVCGHDRGVTNLAEGRFKSGSWVVAVENVRRSIEYGAVLGLHESKADKSYRQGRIVGFDITSRQMVAKREDGIEFVVEATGEPLKWSGDGSGEKGYRWASVARKRSNQQGPSS